MDSEGNTLDFLLCAKRDASAAERFLRKMLNASHTQEPRVINVDKNTAYPPAVDNLKADKQLLETTKFRQVKYLNNLIEQDHRFIKRLTKSGLGFGSFNSARRTLRGMEAMHMLRKGQVATVDKGDIISQIPDTDKLERIKSHPVTEAIKDGDKSRIRCHTTAFKSSKFGKFSQVKYLLISFHNLSIGFTSGVCGG